MLDLVFLVLMIIVLLRSLKGDFNLLMCNIAGVIGVAAAIIGIITAFFSDDASSDFLGIMNVIVLIIAIVLKPAAKHFAKLYQDKVDEATRSYYEEEENAKENFFRKPASTDAYLHAVEKGSAPSGEKTGQSQQSYNGGAAGSPAFPQNGNAAARPMAADSPAFPQNGNTAGRPVAAGSPAFPQTGNELGRPAAASSPAFPQNGNELGRPMAASSPAFPQNGNTAASPVEAGRPVAMSDANSPKMEGISPLPKPAAPQPTDFGSDNNYGLPYDLSAPIDLDHGIDDLSLNGKK